MSPSAASTDGFTQSSPAVKRFLSYLYDPHFYGDSERKIWGSHIRKFYCIFVNVIISDYGKVTSNVFTGVTV